MRHDSTVEKWIGSVLAGSGLPMDRRAEIADEWRDHLSDQIAAKSGAKDVGDALDDVDEAIRVSLAEFGDPAQLRRELRRGQRARDYREALQKTRPIAAWLIVGAGAVGACTALLLPGPGPLLSRMVGGCVLFGALAFPGVIMAFGAGLFELGLMRGRPLDEFYAARSFMRWTSVVAVFFLGTALFGPFAVGLIGYFAQDTVFLSAMHPTPEVMYGAPWAIWRHFGIASCEMPIRSFVVPPLVILVGAMIITRYERSRCVGSAMGFADG